jgi:hypothetical protein
MSLPVLELKKAIRAALLADAPLLALLGGAKVFDEVPRGQSTPYLVFADCLSSDASTSSGRAHQTLLTLLVLSNQGSAKEAHQIAARAEDILHDAALSLTGFRLINLTLAASEARRDRNLESTRVTLKFRAYTERI